MSLAGVLDLRGAAEARLGRELADPSLPAPAGAPVEADPAFGPAVAALAGDGLVPALLGGTPATVPDRYALAAPAGRGIPLLAVHGDAEEIIPAAQARSPYAQESVDVAGAGGPLRGDRPGEPVVGARGGVAGDRAGRVISRDCGGGARPGERGRSLRCRA